MIAEPFRFLAWRAVRTLRGIGVHSVVFGETVLTYIKQILTSEFCLAMVPPLDNKAHAALVLGNKIRALRQRLDRTLDETAMAAAISKPFLSQVERGQATPSITSLVGIAHALGVSVQYFIDTPSEDRSVCRAEGVRFFGFADSVNLFGRLTNMSAGRKLEGILVKMPARQQASEIKTQAGEEFLYVLSGEVSLMLEGTTFVLRAGDTAHYESTVAHGWANTGDEETVLVWVGTPKLF